MPDSFITLPSGVLVHSRNRTSSGNSVEEQYVRTLSSDRITTTRMFFATASLVVGASADSANTGRIYIENDPDSTVLIAVLNARFRSQLASALVAPTSPLISLKSFTFTGNTPSGTTLPGVPLDSTYAAANSNWNVRSAATGMTITEGHTIASFYPVASATAVGYIPPVTDVWNTDAANPLILRAGEGLMVRQIEAGTTSDTRIFSFSFEIEEFTLP
jgi:hypothetical protein